MSPPTRKLALTAHITFSVGWIGAVAAFLALAVAGFRSPDTGLVRGAYLAMDLISWWVIVPCNAVALLTGLIGSLGTPWGLTRHYWVLAKLGLTVVGTLILLAHLRPIAVMAEVAPELAPGGDEFGRLRIRLIVDAGLALLLLGTTTILGVLKPWGTTRFGKGRFAADL